MGWFGNRMMRGATNRAGQRLAAQYGMGPATGILALALGHACYPDATYGDNAEQDDVVASPKHFRVKPTSAKDSCNSVELWLDKNAISTADVFQRVWGMNPDDFVKQFLEFSFPESN